MDYNAKYLKYKAKYLNLKYALGGAKKNDELFTYNYDAAIRAAYSRLNNLIDKKIIDEKIKYEAQQIVLKQNAIDVGMTIDEYNNLRTSLKENKTDMDTYIKTNNYVFIYNSAIDLLKKKFIAENKLKM
jgi:hypothetical protein